MTNGTSLPRRHDAGRKGPVVIRPQLIAELALHERAVAGDAARLVVVLGPVVGQVAKGGVEARGRTDDAIESQIRHRRG